MIRRIHHNGNEIAIIISNSFKAPGVTFVTDGSYSQQLAYMSRPKGEYIRPHYHNLHERSVRLTQEVLVIKSGKMRADFYSSEEEYIGSEIVGAGDVLMLTSGGHAFKMLEPVEMLEVKQGPYAGNEDKTIFQGASETDIIAIPATSVSVDPSKAS